MPGVGVSVLVFATKNKANSDIHLNKMMTKLKDSLAFKLPRTGRVTHKDFKNVHSVVVVNWF